jgi:hypothetical protein
MHQDKSRRKIPKKSAESLSKQHHTRDPSREHKPRPNMTRATWPAGLSRGTFNNWHARLGARPMSRENHISQSQPIFWGFCEMEGFGDVESYGGRPGNQEMGFYDERQPWIKEGESWMKTINWGVFHASKEELHSNSLSFSLNLWSTIFIRFEVSLRVFHCKLLLLSIR